MNRESALVLSILFFLLFFIITYYGAKVTLWSSIIFSVFVVLILLNIFYPPSNIADSDVDFSLYIYAAFEIIGIALLGIYIVLKTLSDVQCCELQC